MSNIEVVDRRNVEIINGIEVDFNLFKPSKNIKGRNLEKAKEGFIKLCNLLHSKGYTLESNYINSKEKVLINFGCNHESSYISTNALRQGQGCPRCAGFGGQAKINFENLVKSRGHKLKSEYVDTITKVLIDYGCSHPNHWILPAAYRIGQQCPRCVGLSNEQAKEDFIKLVKSNGHKLIGEYVNIKTKVEINFGCSHPNHMIMPSAYKSGKGCPLCKHKGESMLYDILVDIFGECEVEGQKTFHNLKDKKNLRYDFYIRKYNLLIELDGEHHREEVMYFKNDATQQVKEKAEADAFLNLQKRKKVDKIKDDYARVNNIHLLRIEYNSRQREIDVWRKLVLDKVEEIKLIDKQYY